MQHSSRLFLSYFSVTSIPFRRSSARSHPPTEQMTHETSIQHQLNTRTEFLPTSLEPGLPWKSNEGISTALNQELDCTLVEKSFKLTLCLNVLIFFK